MTRRRPTVILIGCAVLFALSHCAGMTNRKAAPCRGTAKITLDANGAPEKFEISCSGTCPKGSESTCDRRLRFAPGSENRIYERQCSCEGIAANCGPVIGGPLDMTDAANPKEKPPDHLYCAGIGCEDKEECRPVIKGEGQKPEVPKSGVFDKGVPLKNGKKGVIDVECKCLPKEQ